MVYPSINPEHIQNRKITVNLSDFFFYHEKNNHLELYQKAHDQLMHPTREEVIEALEKDAKDFSEQYGLDAELHFYRITPRMLAEDYLSRQ